MLGIIQSVILTGIEVLGCDLFFRTFMQERHEEKRWLRGVVDAILLLAWLMNATYVQNFWIKSLSATIIMAGLMLILYKAKISQIFFCAICYEGIVWGMDAGLLAVAQYFMDGTVSQLVNSEGRIVLLWIIFKLILFLFIVIINRKFSKEDYQVFGDDEWIRFLFLPVFTVMAILLMLQDESIQQKTMLFISFGLLGANIIFFYLIQDFARRAEDRRRTSLVWERSKNQIETYESMELAYNQQKKKVHEFKNQLDCIQGLLQEHKEKEALAYVGEINHLAEYHMDYFATLNPVVDVVINQKYQQAREEGISVVAVLDELDGIPMENNDLVILLSNLWNNGIEICRKLKPERRMIKFKFQQNAEQILISIRNPVEGRGKIIDNKGKTTKKNKQEHGIGFYNIEKVVEKYGGEEECSNGDGQFVYTIIFQKEKMKMGKKAV